MAQRPTTLNNDTPCATDESRFTDVLFSSGRMVKSGWIKVHRRIEDHEFYFAERFTKISALMDLHLLANSTDTVIVIKGIEVPLKRGETAYSMDSLARRWNWDRKTVKRFLELCVAHGYMTVKYSKNTTTVIHLTDYEINQARFDEYAKRPEVLPDQPSEIVHRRDIGNSLFDTADIEDSRPEHKMRDNEKDNKTDIDKKNKKKSMGASKVIDAEQKNPKELHSLFQIRFKEATGEPYHVASYGRELKDISLLLKTFDADKVRNIIEAYFRYPNQWTIDNVYPWGGLIRGANKLLNLWEKNSDRTQASGIDDATAMEQFLRKRKGAA